jgi:hypothetical protein
MMVTDVLPVISVAVVGSHPFTMVEPPDVDEDDDPVVEVLVVVVLPPDPPVPPLLLPHAPATIAATAHTKVIEVEFFT